MICRWQTLSARKFSLTRQFRCDFAKYKISDNDQHTTLCFEIKQYILCSIYTSFIGFRWEPFSRRARRKILHIIYWHRNHLKCKDRGAIMSWWTFRSTSKFVNNNKTFYSWTSGQKSLMIPPCAKIYIEDDFNDSGRKTRGGSFMIILRLIIAPIIYQLNDWLSRNVSIYDIFLFLIIVKFNQNDISLIAILW